MGDSWLYRRLGLFIGLVMNYKFKTSDKDSFNFALTGRLVESSGRISGYFLNLKQGVKMPSFDIVSEIDKHELQNAVDQANKEVTTRYDFKGTDSSFELKDSTVTLKTESDFQLNQMYDMLLQKANRRGIDVKCMDPKDPDIQLKSAKQVVEMREGIEAPLAKKIIKAIKDSKMKVQTANQGDSVRVTGKKRDDLQQVMQMLKGMEDLDMPLQFNNFRD